MKVKNPEKILETIKEKGKKVNKYGLYELENKHYGKFSTFFLKNRILKDHYPPIYFEFVLDYDSELSVTIESNGTIFLKDVQENMYEADITSWLRIMLFVKRAIEETFGAEVVFEYTEEIIKLLKKTRTSYASRKAFR